MNFKKIGSLFTRDETNEVPKGRSMIGYSRRGFLGMLGVAIATPALPGITPEPLLINNSSLGEYTRDWEGIEAMLQDAFPVIGAIALGEMIRDVEGRLYVCTQAGSGQRVAAMDIKLNLMRQMEQLSRQHGEFTGLRGLSL